MWGMPSNNACIAHSGVHSAWFTKAKQDGAKTKWLGNSTVRRLFTIDFDKKVLFYRHSESERGSSSPISFSSILGATRPNDRAKVPLGSSLSMHRSLSTSLLKLAPNCVEYPIIIHTSERRIRLNADTDAQARAWVEALNAAHRLGKGNVPKPIVTHNAPAWTTGSRLASRNISPSMSSNATESTVEGEGSEEDSGMQSPTASEPSPSAAQQVDLLLENEANGAVTELGACVWAAACGLESEAEEARDGAETVGVDAPDLTIVGDSSGRKVELCAADFGFDEDLDDAPVSEGDRSAPSTPRSKDCEDAASENSFFESDGEDTEQRTVLQARRALDLRLVATPPSKLDLFQRAKPVRAAWDQALGERHDAKEEDLEACDREVEDPRMVEDLRLLISSPTRQGRRSKKVQRSGSSPCLGTVQQQETNVAANTSRNSAAVSAANNVSTDRAAADLELVAKKVRCLQARQPPGRTLGSLSEGTSMCAMVGGSV
mmetsp:Transcript_4681/g.11372  ORF Transcript_4681/g.11372 Transcript_4681/m.11372 type:complete len:489 (-) Transcript_4681:165-1631(-)